MAAMVALSKVAESLERFTNVGFSTLNYCPETVLVHCAFLLAHKEAGQSLVGMEKRTCSQVVRIVSETVREVTTQTRQTDCRKFLDAGTKGLEFKIHFWVFTSLLKSYDTLDPGESPEEDYLDRFPPLPQFDINFYVSLVHEIGWADLLVEVIFAIGEENVSSILEDIIKCLVQQPSCKDLFLFQTLFMSLLMMGKQNSTFDDHQEIKLDSISVPKSWWLLLLCGMANLAKDYLCWPEAQMEIIKTLTDFTFESFIDLNFKKQNSMNKKSILPNSCLVGNVYPCEQRQAHNDKELEAERASGHKMRVIAEEIANSGIFVSAEVAAGFDLLCHLITNDWRGPLHWIHTEVPESVGEIDCNTWHPLHKWIIKLYAMSRWLVFHSLDSTVLEQATKLQKGLAKYVKTFSTKAELIWIDGIRGGELLEAGESYITEEFSPHTESVELLLFQPETSEQQFRFYLKQVNGRLEGYKECFDWLLSAEEFHSESDWLECMRNHAVQISDVPHAQKIIDIIYMQRELLCSCKESSDIIYMDMKEILLHLFTAFPWFSQEEIIEYAFMMNLTLNCSEEESLFFHPHFITQERESFQQDLIMVFNKLIDISSEDQLHSAVKEFARATLVSPQLTLNKAVHEGLKSVGHSEAICSMLWKLPTVCLLKCNEPASPWTLLCCAVKSVTMNLTSRQEENNLLCMVSMMLSGSFESSPLLSVREFLEAVVLPYLNSTNAQHNIPTILALKLLSTSMAVVTSTGQLHLNSVSKHLLPIILCLCELLNESNVFWTGLAPEHSLSEMEEVRELVLKALDTVIKLYSDVLVINPAFARGVEWLFKRLSSDFDWTVPLYLKKLFTSAHIQCKFPVPYCLSNVCEDMGEEWEADKHLAYGVGDVFTVLFEYCRISESALQRIMESLVPNRLTVSFQDIRKYVVASLTQILPHCTWKEWQRILDMCRYLIRKNILKDSTQVILCLQANGNEVCKLSALLLDMMKALHSPLCSPWATPVVWLYVIKHYIMALKEIVDETTDVAVTAPVFSHVCHVMTVVSADFEDQLFVLALDLVARPSFMNDDISEQLKMSINTLTSEVYKAALLQKLDQNF